VSRPGEPPPEQGYWLGPAGIDAVRLREQLRRALAHSAMLEAQIRQLEGELARLRRLYGVETPVLVDGPVSR